MRKLLGLIVVLIFCSLVSCSREQGLYCKKHKKYFKELPSLDCHEYEFLALCESYSFMRDTGAIGDIDYFDGKITIYTTLGELVRVVPLRCELDKNLTELTALVNKKGTAGRFADSFSFVGINYIDCSQIQVPEKKSLPDQSKLTEKKKGGVE